MLVFSSSRSFLGGSFRLLGMEVDDDASSLLLYFFTVFRNVNRALCQNLELN